MVFSDGFSIFSFFPAVAITTVANLFPRVEEHGTTFWSENDKEILNIYLGFGFEFGPQTIRDLAIVSP